jgi:CDP-diacylglycerol--glycerol-3-phosphate 3-phosphatidyltransferase
MQSESKALKHRIPWLMASARAALGPVVVIGERAGWSGLTLAKMVVAALLSDIFDGVLARRWKCDTAGVRLFDSMADNIFYLGCATVLWMRQPLLMWSFAVPIGVVLGIEVLKFAFDVVKFGKPSSYHSYLAKTWGLVLATTVVVSFATRATLVLQIAWWASLTLGVIACLEGLAMSLIMPEWRHDLKTLGRALALRREILLYRRRDAQRLARLSEIARTTVSAALILALVTVSAHAASIPSVTFIGGSTPGIAASTTGALETGADQIAFQWQGGSFSIPYAQIQNFSYREKKTVNLGLLPLIAVVLIRPQPQRHIVSITFLDTSGQKQVAIFEVPKQAGDILPVVLQERTGVCSDQYQTPCRTGVARDSHRVMARGAMVP